MRRFPFVLGLSIVIVALSGCASSPSGPTDRIAGVAPMLSVERFLQAANTGDLEAMARIFGTADGPIADRTGNTFSCAFKKVGSWIGLGSRCLTRTDIELRMDVIASLLRHDDYRIRSESDVPGRQHPTSRIGVDLDLGNTRYSDVPFVVVQTSEGQWLVEEVGLERITAWMVLPREPISGGMGYVST